VTSLPERSAPVRHSSLRVVSPRKEVDLLAAEQAVTDLLIALGKDPMSEHLSDTPRRVARSFAELLTPREFDLTTFPNDEGYDELVLAKNIPVQSLCEHHPGSAGSGAPDPAGRRRAAGAPGAQRGRRGDRSRAFVYVTAGRSSHRLAHRDLSLARGTARGRSLPAGVLRASRRGSLTAVVRALRPWCCAGRAATSARQPAPPVCRSRRR
jgi:hypothetical protein